MAASFFVQFPKAMFEMNSSWRKWTLFKKVCIFTFLLVVSHMHCFVVFRERESRMNVFVEAKV